MFPCTGCFKRFKDNSGLLRHIGHRPICKDFYGLEKYDDMRKEAQLLSKRKWKQTHASEFKKKYKEQKGKAVKKKKHIPDDERSTEAGLAFDGIFKNIYVELETELCQGNDKMNRMAYDAVVDKAHDDALDYTFESRKFVGTFYLNFEFGDHLDEIDEEEEIKNVLKSTFDNKFKENIHKYMDEWIADKEEMINAVCCENSRDTAFRNIYPKFKELFLVCEDIAMDHAFEALDEEVADEDFRQELEKNYQKQIREELLQNPWTQVRKQIKEIVNKSIQKHIRKLNASVQKPTIAFVSPFDEFK